MPILSGKTMLAAGQPLANANVVAYNSNDNTLAASGTSSAQGEYSLTVPSIGPFFVVSYVVSPAFRAGTTRRDLMAVAEAINPPGAPTIGTAVAGNGYVDVYFDVPADDGGAPILDYTAKLSPTGEEATGTSSPIRVAASNGTARTATATARTSAGNGAASQPSNVVTPTASSTPAATVRSLWTGLPTSDGVYVSARLTDAGSAGAARLVVSASESLTNPVQTASVTPDEYRIVKQQITGRQPNTEYWYAVEVDGVVDPTIKGRFKTLPAAGAANFTVALGCCSNNTVHSDNAWTAIRDAKPLVFVMLGDWTYSNSSVTAEADRIGQYDSCLTMRPIRQEVHATIPTDYIYDDHDFGPDDATGLDDNNAPVPYRQASIAAFRRRYPAPLLSSDPTHTVDHSYVIGRVRFVVMDCRADRSGQYRADDATKSMLGAPQKARWKAQIDAAAAAGQVVCMISTIPWTGSGWGAYATDVYELSNYIKSKGMGNKRVFVIAGDMHAMALVDSVDYASGGGAQMSVFQVGAMHSPFTSIKGNAYSQGPFGKAGVQTADGLTPNNYGTMEVVDDGTNLTIRWKGYDAEAGVMRIRHSFAALGALIPEPMAPQTKPAAPTAVPGNASAVVTVAAPQNATPAITGIVVESDAGGTDVDAGTLELVHDITGLTNNVAVKFRVKERNALGDSPWSDWSSPAVMPTASGGTIPPSTLQLTGGTVTVEDGWEVHTFTSSADMVVTQAGEAKYFAAGGAGSGGASGTGTGGGGGAGEAEEGTMTFPVGTHPVVIGQGGASVTGTTVGNNGTDTTVGSLITAKGGGAGGSGTTAAKSGASGGGAGAGSSSGTKGAGTPGQGNDGGMGNGHADNLRSSGGGGGATSPGQNGSVDANGTSGKGGDGGEGVTFDGKEYCGGGGGCGRNGGTVGQGKARGGRGGNSVVGAALAGADNSGSGGGGTTGSVASGKGGSGIFIVKKKL